MELYLPYYKYFEQYGHKSDALFHALKAGILSGAISAGTKLPSSRQLALTYGLSRGTVNVVYERLHSQGFVRSVMGSGTFVIYHQLDVNDRSLKLLVNDAELSDWGKRLVEIELHRGQVSQVQRGSTDPISFTLGQVDVTHFPVHEWNRLMFGQVREQYKKESVDAYSSEGHAPLRESIAQHLHTFRGINVNADNVVIVNGSQQAIALIIQLLINEGDAVAMENPHYVGLRNAVHSVGGKVHAFPVDDEGIVFTTSTACSYKLLIVTPSRQFPKGVVLSMERRQRLLQWAEENNAYIIEDDYDSEFRHYGRANEPLKSLDRNGRVIYIGTFSKTMMQNIRLGYAVLPDALKNWFTIAKKVYERHPSSIIEQRALADFMNTGLYDRHIRRMKRIYRKKAELLLKLLTEQMQDVLALYPIDAGLHIYARWKGTEVEFEPFLRCCEQLNVQVADARASYLGDSEQAFCLGYAHLDEQQITDGVMRMVEARKNVGGVENIQSN
ncbi:MAG TPA: PLP-dependent aminotransferase family protein [Candidatus Paenibacillus intestinavium]|nr:PLP-dependent aminotransferase family protein [Candidatus Paenibacillus intestinavium]